MEKIKKDPPMEDIMKTDRIFEEDTAADTMEDNMKSDRFIEKEEAAETMEENMTTDRHLENDNFPNTMEDVMKTDRYKDEIEGEETDNVVDSDQATLDKEENA